MADVLVVDDDRDLQENIQEVLAQAGFGVTLATRAEEALELLRQREYDVVLLDLMMPGMGGMEALPLIRRQAPRACIVMVTAFATVQNAVEAMRLGAEDYLVKPFRIDELTVTVKRCIESAGFSKCALPADAESTFHCLANALRRDILRLLHRQGSLRFMDVTRGLDVEDHTKINFHLKTLRDAGLIGQDDRKRYELTAEGRRVLACVADLAADRTGQ
jgi:DNA-binding response OmpR family regulator